MTYDAKTGPATELPAKEKEGGTSEDNISHCITTPLKWHGEKENEKV